MKDIHVAVVEDEFSCAQQLRSYIVKALDGTQFNPVITHFNQAESFLSSTQISGFSLVFMDIALGGIDGMSAATEFRNANKTAVLIFVTNMAQMAIRGYAVDALDFILKPIIYQDFSFKMQRVIRALNARISTKLQIKFAGGAKVVSSEDILYVEVKSHILYWHLADEVISQATPLSKIEDKLRSLGFLKANRCYLVNPQYIERVDGYSVTVAGNELQISRPQKKAFMQQLNEYITRGAK